VLQVVVVRCAPEKGVGVGTLSGARLPCQAQANGDFQGREPAAPRSGGKTDELLAPVFESQMASCRNITGVCDDFQQTFEAQRRGPARFSVFRSSFWPVTRKR